MFYKKRVKEFMERNFGKNPLDSYFYDATTRMDRVRKYHNVMKVRKEEFTKEMNFTDSIDQITWDDLEMDQIFLRINHTQSFIGEQVLYHQLHELSRTNEEKRICDFERRQDFLKKNKKQRLDIQARLYEIGKREESYSLPGFINNLQLWRIEHPIFIYLMQGLLLFFIVFFALTKSAFAGTGLILVILFNTMIYFRMKQKYDSYLYSLGNIKQIYSFVNWMIKEEEVSQCVSEKVKKSAQSLKKLSKLVFSLTDRKQGVNTGELAYLIQEYLFGLTLIDMALFNYIMKITWDKQEDVLTLYEFTGEMDAAIAVLSYRTGIDKWCYPDFRNGSMEAKELVHPLIQDAVSNDFFLEDKMIITGANASGKSTFMKAVAINAILAQTIHTCTAREFALSQINVMTCMALRDDVISGESYYFREAKYLKRMIDMIDADLPVFCVIDEILKGTNTVERIAASKAILEHISSGKCFIMIATHDKELTETEAYKKYYFTSVIENRDVRFDYKIHEGVCKDTNAIALLKVLGYPKDIFDNACASCYFTHAII